MTRAAHVSKNTSNGSVHAVGIGDLRVMIVHEDGVWYAQGLEVDYLAQGASLEDAQEAFEVGLFATIAEHLNLFGDIKRLLRPADQTIWEEFYSNSNNSEELALSIHSVHEISKVMREDPQVFVAATKAEGVAAVRRPHNE